MNLLKLEYKTINKDAIAMIEQMTKGRLLVTLTCGKETMISASEAECVRRQLDLDRKPTVYLPPVESYLSVAEQEAWSFIQNNDDQKLSIGRIHEFLIGSANVKDGKLQQAGEILNRLKRLDLIRIEHASGDRGNVE